MSTKHAAKELMTKAEIKAELRYAKARRQEAEMNRRYYISMSLPLPTSLREQKERLETEIQMLDRDIELLQSSLE